MRSVGADLEEMVAHVMCASVWKNRHTWCCVLTALFIFDSGSACGHTATAEFCNLYPAEFS